MKVTIGPKLLQQIQGSYVRSNIFVGLGANGKKKSRQATASANCLPLVGGAL